MLVLRPYQVTAYDILTAALKSKKRKALLVAPTGSGKTVTGLKTVVDLAESKSLKKVVWVAHQTDLAIQSKRAMEQHFPVAKTDDKNTVILNGTSYSFMPWQALRTKKDLEKYDVLIVDEFHQGSSGAAVSHKSFTKIILDSSIKYQLYVTATPHNLDPKLTSDLFLNGKLNKKYCARISLNDLEKFNAVSNVSMIMVQTSDTLKLREWDGESDKFDGSEEMISGKNTELADKIKEKRVSTTDIKSKKAIWESVRKTLLRHYYEQEIKHNCIPPTLMFAPTLPAAKVILSEIRKIFSAKKTKLGPNDVRIDHCKAKDEGIQKDFREGKFPIMIVIKKAREGFDYPALEVAVDFCPSRSKNGETSQVQKLGRLLRPHPSKKEARYYLPDSVNFYIAQRGVRQEFNPGFKDRIFGIAKGVESFEDVEAAKEFVSDAVGQTMALRQAESGEENPIVHLSSVEFTENEYEDYEDDVAVGAVRKSIVGNKCKVRAVKVAYAITEACMMGNPQISSFPLFDGGICQRASGAEDPENKKKELIEIAKNGGARPSKKYPLGWSLGSYINKSHKSYDLKFKLQIEELAPKWFEDSAADKKQKLIEMAKNGEDRPNSRKHPLGPSFNQYIVSNTGTYDAEFTSYIKKLAPQWFEDAVKLKKQKLIEMAKNGEEKPIRGKHPLGSSLSMYAGTRARNMFDEEFSNLIRKLRPDWFVKNTKVNKEKLIEMAKNGEERPPQKKHILGPVLGAYTRKKHSCYDPEFDKKIRELRPDWFTS